MAQNIEFPVSLGLLAATDLINKLRELLKNAVKIDTSAFRGLDSALGKALTQVAKLKSEMSSAFLTTNGTKKFLGLYDRLFESLSAIGERFGFLKETDMIFSPLDAAELKEMRNNLEALDNLIKLILSGKIGKIFDDSSVDSIKEVLEVATLIGVTLSKTTFSEFGLKLTGKMAETKELITLLRELITLLNNAANGAELKKDSIFSQLSMDKLMGNTAEILDKNSAKTLREKISSLYELYGLSDIDLSKTIKSGGNIDLIFVAEEERVRSSTDKYINILLELKLKILEEIDKFDEGIKLSGGDGKRANWETKLAYIDEIKLKYAGLLTFSDVPDSVLKNGTGITKYIENFKKELQEGLNKLLVSDITRDLLQKVWSIFNSIDGKLVITDASSFKTLVETILKETLGNIDLSGVTNDIKNGMGLDDALDRILVNVKNKLKESGNTEALEQEADKLQAAYDKMARAAETVRTTESSENNSLKDKLVAFEELTLTVLEYVAARLGITQDSVALILSGDTNAINNGRSALEQYINSLNKLENKLKTLSSVLSAVTHWMGFYLVLNLTKKAINDMKLHIQELDSVMTSISVVTNFSQEDLWGQISKYSEIARQYGVAIKGVYEVSLIYYQQGLQQNDVMTLTTETLKMARIAGLDYATAADYMTTAIRGFKLEMTEAAHVTDVFSALAATTASSTEEIAVAISKTAASAEAVGASFEATSAMMATMISTTRESATNIGTALKSVISRYGEMTGDPSKTVDSEGEEMSLNRVDKALLTVGITIHDTAGLFRDFDDVMLELMEKWDSLDSLSQRYIATLMAGNRLQSRFLALVSNVDEYKKALETAMNSEGTGELLTLKTLDSIDAKIERMKVTIQEFYTSSGLEELYKNVIDTITNIISAANSLPKAFGKIPVLALAIGTSLVSVIKNVITLILSSISSGVELMKHNTSSALEGLIAIFSEKGRRMGEAVKRGMEEGASGAGKTIGNLLTKGLGLALLYIGAGLSAWGAAKTISGINAYGASTSKLQDQLAGLLTKVGGILGIAGSAASGAAMGTMIQPGIGTAIGAVAGALKGVIENLATLKSASDMYNVTLAREIELNNKRTEELKTEEAKAKGEEKSLILLYDKLIELQKHLYDSVEAMAEYTNYMNLLGEDYPKFILSIDSNGDVLIDVTALEEALADARKASAEATLAAAKAEMEGADLNKLAYEELLTGVNGLKGFDIDTLRFASRQAMKYALQGYLPNAQLIAAYNERYGANLPIDLRLGHDNVENYNTIMSHFNDFMLYWNELAAEGNEGILNYSRQLLKSIIESFNGQHLDLDIAKLLGFDDTDGLIKSINSYSDFLGTLDKIDNIASLYIDHASEVLDNVGEAVKRAEISKKVLDSLTELLKSDKKSDRELGRKLQDYASLLSFLFNVEPSDEELKKAELLILNNEQDATRLTNVDYSKIRSFDDIELGAFEEYKERFEQDYYEYRENLMKGFSSLLKSLEGNLDKQLFLKLAYGGLNGGLVNELIPLMREHLSRYSSLLLSGLPALADNYRLNLEAFYTNISSLSLDLQLEISSLLPNIDFTDSESLLSAASTLEEMGPLYKDLAKSLTDAAERFINNALLILALATEAITGATKAVETAFDNLKKVFKKSEALKNAEELLADYTGPEKYNWDDLYTYDKDLGGYFENENAFMIRMFNARLAALKLVDKAKKSVKLESSVVQAERDRYYNLGTYALFNEDDWKLDTNKVDFSEATGLSGLDLDAAWAWLLLAVVDFNELLDTGEQDFSKYLTKRVRDDLKELNKAEQEIIDLYQNMSEQELDTFDYSKIVSGLATILSKSYLQGLLTLAIDPEKFELDQERFNEAYATLITGDLDSWNTYIDELNTKTGSNIAHANKGQANRARFEGLTSLYLKIASGDVVWDALTQQEQELLNSVEGVNLAEGASTELIGAAADNVWIAITKLILAGAGTLDEVADTIAGKADKDFKDSNAGKLYNLLTSYKDGFTSLEAQALGLLDDDGKLKAEFSSYLERDSNGNWVAQAGLNAASVILSLARLLNISIDKTTDEYKDAIKDGINLAIADADKADIGKQRTQVWQSVMSGKVGDRISLDGADRTTKAFMEAAGLISNTSAEFVYILSEKQLNDAIAWMKNWLKKDVNVLNNPLTARYFLSMVSDWEAKTAKNAAFEGVIGETVSKSAAQALSLALLNTSESDKVDELMESLGFKWDLAALVWNASLETINNTKAKLAEALAKEEITPETYNQLIAKLNDTANAIDPSNKLNNAILSLLQSYTNISEEMRAVFLTNFSKYGSNIAGLFKDNGNGTFSVDPGLLISFLNSVGFEFNEAVLEEIVTISDSYLTNIKNATNYTILGTTSLVEIDSFRKKYEEIVLEALPENAFQYNNILDAWTLDPEILLNFVRLLALDLVRQGLLAQSEVESYINSQVIQPMAQAVDIKSFLESENLGGLATLNLTTLILNLLAAVGKRDASYYRDLAKNELMATKGLTFESATALTAGKMNEYLKAAEQFNKEHEYLLNTTAQSIINTLKAGGEAAVKAGQEIAKEEVRELTSAEVDQLYRNPVKQLLSIIDLVGSLEVGNVVSSDVANILDGIDGFDVDSQGVITSMGNLKDAYLELYNRLKALNTQVEGETRATTYELNAAYVKVLEAEDQLNIDTKTALDNAAGMTFEAFSDLITRYGEAYDYSLENAINSLSDLGAERTNFGQIRVVDFNKFASRLNLNIDSHEYAEAYSKWVDSMAQLQNQPITVMNNAADLISNIVKAKPGEFVNITYLGQELNDKLEDIVGLYGATLKDGLLELGSNADIAGLTTRIAEEAAKAGTIIPEKLGEIRDAVEEMLSNIATLLSNGISGKLDNSQASLLNEWAKLLDEFKGYFANNDSLNFTRTTDGLKLATAQAIKLYNVIKNIDAILGQNVLKNIMDTNDNYATVASTMNRIAELRKKIEEADGNTSSARIQLYQEELSLAQEILAIRSGTEDQSFNFMSNKIEGALNNPLNYWKNWITAMDTIKKSRKSGSMGYEEFYNIVTEMGRIASLTENGITIGKSILSNSQDAANLITAAASALKNVKGEVKVDFKVLANMGWDFSANAGEMNKGIEEGIQNLAKSQVSMLDAMIQLLETVVAMEDLEDVDADMDMHIDLNEIFTFDENTGDITGFTELFDKWRKSIKDKIAKEIEESSKDGEQGTSLLLELLKSIFLDDFSLNDLLTNEKTFDAAWWTSLGQDYQERFSLMLTAFYLAAMSGDWDLSNYDESFKQELLSKMPDGVSVDLGDRTFYITGNTLFSIDWTNEDALKKFKTEVGLNDKATVEEAKAKARELIKERKNENITAERAIEIDYALGLLSGLLTISGDDKHGYTGTYHGYTVSGNNLNEIKEKISAIIKRENEGFTVTVDSEGNVTGTLKVGNSKIKVTNNGKGDEYEAISAHGSRKFFGPNGKEKAIGWLASQGEGEQGTYQYSDGKTYNVFVDEKTLNTYSIDNDGKFHADGFTFDSYEKLLEYFTFKDLTKGGNYSFDDDSVSVISVDGKTRVTWHNDGSIDYEFWDPVSKSYKSFASPEDYQEYLKAWKLPNAHLNNDNQIEYNLQGAIVVADYVDGKIHYTAHLANGHTVEAWDEASLRAGIATASQLTPVEGSIKPEESGGEGGEGKKDGLHYKIDENFVVDVNATGTTVLVEDPAKTDVNDKTQEQIESITEGQTYTAPAEKVEIDPTQATVELTKAIVALTEHLSGATAILSNLLLTTNNDTDISLVKNSVKVKKEIEATGDVAHLVLGLTEEAKVAFLTGIAIPTALDGTAEASAESLLTILLKIKNYKPTTKAKLTGEKTFKDNANAMKEELDELASYDPVDISVILTGGGAIRGMVDGLISKVKELAKTWIITFEGQKTGDWPDSTGSGSDEGTGTGKGKEIVDPKQPHFIKATGNFGLAKSKGTLMGELGPELVVSNGRYFVVGLNGPEFVNLADDAIVFNHLQTKQLLDKGMSNTRGRAVTNERNAVAYALGSINGGPAMSSASEMLAYLKQLREMWHKLTDLSIKDLTSTGGGGGGGGGNKEFLKLVERWYNLLQKIAELEEKITYEEQRRKLLTVSGIKDGKAYYASLKQSLAAMKEQVEANAQLAREQEEYFNKRRDELNSKKNPFNAFYTFDERGQLQYSDRTFSYGGKTYSAFEYLNEINKKNADGTAAYSPTKLLDMLAQGMGLDLAKIRKQYGTYTEYDDKGKGTQKTRTDEEILELLWKQMESDLSEMQSLHDSIKDYQKAVMEAQEKQAQIIKEMKDNQLAVEKDVYDAIVDMRERAIEEMQDLRDAYEDSTDKFITGLTNALDKERQMYLTQLAESDLDKKRRRVAILQRTGGSGAEIASLQAEIESDELELYFEKLQQEIDAIQEAADKQIEKLDQLIELEEELLEYQKEHGLLWQDVSKIMRGTSDEIVSFITTNNSEWWAKSPLATAQDLEDALFKAEQWTQFRDDDGKYFEEILAAIQRVAEGKQPTEEDSTASEDLEYNKKEGSKSIEDKSKYKVTYKDQNGDEQTRYFRSKKLAEDFLKDNKKKYKDMKVKSLGTKAYWVFAHKLNWQTGDEPEVFGPYTKTYALLKEKELKNNPIYDDKFVKMSENKSKKEAPKKPQGFSEGGLNTTTGLAMLHGTPQKPEAVFNAEQTEVLRNKILSNKPTSLLSLLQSLQGAMATAANNTTNINRSAATEIGSIALNMNVSQIANDYDAKRAGEQAMTEMLRIARKTNVTAIRG